MLAPKLQPNTIMANTLLFPSTRGSLFPEAGTFNGAGGKAYRLSPEALLARLAATGCFGEVAQLVEQLKFFPIPCHCQLF